MRKNMLAFTVAVVSFGIFCAPAAASENNSGSSTAAQQTAVLAQTKYQLRQKVYKQVKGWWTNESAGTCDWKVTQKKIKIYSRSTGECIEKLRIYGCKKVEDGYIIKAKNNNGQKVAYSFDKKQNTLCSYQDSDHDGICDNYENGGCGGNRNGGNGSGHRRCAR